eukprot:scaffold182344_cov36-Prasinocladus_malaysianus.AAC.1
MQRKRASLEKLHEEGGLNNELAHHVRVEVGGGTAVLIVATLLDGDHAANADRAAAVGNPPAEVIHAACLVFACEAALVTLTILGNVDSVALAELFALLLDGVPAGALSASEAVGVVGVTASTVPVAWDWLGVKGHGHVVHLCKPIEDVAAHPEIITHLLTHAWANLTEQTLFISKLLRLKQSDMHGRMIRVHVSM